MQVYGPQDIPDTYIGVYQAMCTLGCLHIRYCTNGLPYLFLDEDVIDDVPISTYRWRDKQNNILTADEVKDTYPTEHLSITTYLLTLCNR